LSLKRGRHSKRGLGRENLWLKGGMRKLGGAILQSKKRRGKKRLWKRRRTEPQKKYGPLSIFGGKGVGTKL